MTEISFALIRKKNPDLNFDNIEEISTIHLNNCSIEDINNLELFSHIKHLDLAHNKISFIRELHYLNKLETLDLSFNSISSEGLSKSLSELPKGLKSINLTGNSCVNDEDALVILQDFFPDLGIIIDTVDNNLDAVESCDVSTPTTIPEQYDNNIRPLNADTLLKSIVERKCKLQSMSSFNLDRTISDLNNEFDSAESSMKEKRNNRTSNGA